MQSLKRFLTDECAATTVEYAVMLALILMSIISAVSAVGSQHGGMWGNINGEMTNHGI